jgi:Ni,Fe-hydrogenase III small subunit/uncharacterized Fe-S cluster protein YjdI
MSQWLIKGLRTGVKTTDYPSAPETAPGISPGFPKGVSLSEEAAEALVPRCPTGALKSYKGKILVDQRRCVHSFRCVRGLPTPLDWSKGYEWAYFSNSAEGKGKFESAFNRSVHILIVDTGDCGACLNEVKQLNSPYYNMHRLGFFLTPTPRHADLMLVVGPVTDHMRVPLLKAFDAMPPPKRVIAVGACALSGGVFGPSFACGAGAAEVVPVDVEVPGNPPPPLAILHGLLVAVGRKPPTSFDSGRQFAGNK